MDISPDNQNIDRVFSNITYHIDFYQREYRWSSEPVQRLLDDVLYKFNEDYVHHGHLKPDPEIITAKYSWYYLNTYVTNEVDGRLYIVDGQQRLTTLSLVLMKLYRMALEYHSELDGWISQKILGQSGFKRSYWLNHAGCAATQDALYAGETVPPIPIDDKGRELITARNMANNFSVIDKHLSKELDTKNRLETFVFYFLKRLVLIALKVERTDVPMVFEVINDRGVRLKPHEILKGKLLGQIDKFELEKFGYNKLWEDSIANANQFGDDEIDTFFRYYLRAKYADSRKEGQTFDGDYHRRIMSQDMESKLALAHDPEAVKYFLKEPLRYYTALYAKVRRYYNADESGAYRYVHFNSLNELDGQLMLVLSSCQIDDPEEDEKIRAIAFHTDRLFSLLQLQSAYDSNQFQVLQFLISKQLRDKPASRITSAFNLHIAKELGRRRNAWPESLFQYAYFKNVGFNLQTRFKRYVLSRVELFLAENMNLGMKHRVADLVMKRGHVNGFHVEHILSWNDENLALFSYDDEIFDQERNRLGGLLLLKGKDNISSNNETYLKKLKSYSNTLYWNETLREDAYKSKLDMRYLRKHYDLDLKAVEQFGPQSIEDRQRLLFKILAIIWHAENVIVEPEGGDPKSSMDAEERAMEADE